MWMSATLEPGWLDTIDFRDKFPAQPLELDEKDYDPERPLYKRMTAKKTSASSKEGDDKEGHGEGGFGEPGATDTQTLVVLNTVERAKAVYTELEKLRKKASTRPKLLLVHSRFRPHERQKLNEQLQAKGDDAADRIIVATQVVEAGVDISARTFDHRTGPVGEHGPAHRPLQSHRRRRPRTGVLDRRSKRRKSRPALLGRTISTFAREHLENLDGGSVSPKASGRLQARNEKPGEPFLPFEHKHVLRRRDLLDLFDTSPDLSGNDIDIQRFVRSDDPDTDVQVFWRDIPNDGPTTDESSPHRREICSVPIGQVRGFLELLAEKKRGAGYIWDHLDEQWVKLDPKRLRPGLAILLPVSASGYTSDLGWNPEGTATVTPLAPSDSKPEGAGDDPHSAGAAVDHRETYQQCLCRTGNAARIARRLGR